MTPIWPHGEPIAQRLESWYPIEEGQQPNLSAYYTPYTISSFFNFVIIRCSSWAIKTELKWWILDTKKCTKKLKLQKGKGRSMQYSWPKNWAGNTWLECPSISKSQISIHPPTDHLPFFECQWNWSFPTSSDTWTDLIENQSPCKPMAKFTVLLLECVQRPYKRKCAVHGPLEDKPWWTPRLMN